MAKKNATIEDSVGRKYAVQVKTYQPIEKAITPASNVQDPFDGLYSRSMKYQVLEPPYNPLYLSMLIEQSDILGSVIQAMITNVHGFGWELIPAPHVKDKDILESKEAQQEKQWLTTFLNHVNHRQNITQLRKEGGFDNELTGYNCIEVVRNRVGEIAELRAMPSFTVRKTIRDKEWTEFVQRVRDEDGKYIELQRRERFRRYVQIVNGTERTYFKEFGDPRTISAKTGEEAANPSLEATEVIEFRQMCNYSAYGVPRWIGNLIGILGARKASEVNYLYFDNKAIPPVVITISGGNFTDSSLEQLKEMFDREIKGVANFHKALVLEAVPHDIDDTDDPIGDVKPSPVKIDIKPLTEFMQQDAMFGNYMKDTNKNVMSSYRIPPVLLGKSDDYNRATSREALKMVEEQVFQQERNDFDYTINTQIFAEMQINYWDYRSLGAKTSNDADIVKALGNVQDALPVATIIEAVAEMRNVPMPEIPEEWHQITVGQLRSSLQASIEEPPEQNPDEEPVEKFVTELINLRDKIQKSIDEKESGDDESRSLSNA